MISGADKRLNKALILSYLIGFLYGNTIYYLNLNKMANLYDFKE